MSDTLRRMGGGFVRMLPAAVAVCLAGYVPTTHGQGVPENVEDGELVVEELGTDSQSVPVDTVGDFSADMADTSTMESLEIPRDVPTVGLAGCPSCAGVGLSDLDASAGFLIGPTGLLPQGRMFAYASSDMWLFKRAFRFGDLAVTGGPSSLSNVDYPFLFVNATMGSLQQRVEDHYGYPLGYYYEWYGGG